MKTSTFSSNHTSIGWLNYHWNHFTLYTLRMMYCTFPWTTFTLFVHLKLVNAFKFSTTTQVNNLDDSQWNFLWNFAVIFVQAPMCWHAFTCCDVWFWCSLYSTTCWWFQRRTWSASMRRWYLWNAAKARHGYVNGASRRTFPVQRVDEISGENGHDVLRASWWNTQWAIEIFMAGGVEST